MRKRNRNVKGKRTQERKMRQAKKRSQRNKSKKTAVSKARYTGNTKSYLSITPEKGVLARIGKNPFTADNKDILVFKENPVVSKADYNQLYWGDFDVFPHKHILLNERNRECAVNLFRSIRRTAYTFTDSLQKAISFWEVSKVLKETGDEDRVFDLLDKITWDIPESWDKTDDEFNKHTLNIAGKIGQLSFSPTGNNPNKIVADFLPWDDEKTPLSDYLKSIQLCLMGLTSIEENAADSNRTYGELSRNLFAAQNILRRIKQAYQSLLFQSPAWITESTGVDWFDKTPPVVPDKEFKGVKGTKHGLHSSVVYLHQNTTDYEAYKKDTKQAAQRLHMSLSSALDSSVSNNYDLWNFAYCDYFIDMYLPSVAMDYNTTTVKHPRGVKAVTDWFVSSFLEQTSVNKVFQGSVSVNKAFFPSMDIAEGVLPFRMGMTITTLLEDTGNNRFLDAWDKTTGNSISTCIQFHNPSLSKNKRKKVMETFKKEGVLNLHTKDIYKVYECDRNIYDGDFIEDFYSTFFMEEAA
jgi:hypothetical protein